MIIVRLLNIVLAYLGYAEPSETSPLTKSVLCYPIFNQKLASRRSDEQKKNRKNAREMLTFTQVEDTLCWQQRKILSPPSEKARGWLALNTGEDFLMAEDLDSDEDKTLSFRTINN